MRRWTAVRSGDFRKALRLTAAQEAKVLSRLARSGMIARVWRGLYLVPSRLPLGGRWSPDLGLALDTLMKSRGARYQICGPNAFSRYGFDEQVPNRVYVYNDRLSGDRRIGVLALTLIKVDGSRLGATDLATSAEGLPTVYSSRARSLVDAVYDWARFDTLPRGYDWIRNELAAKRVAATDLVDLTLRYGDKGTVRRMGAFLDREGIAEPLLRKLARRLPATTGPIPLVPTRPKRGQLERRWAVVWNAEG